MPYRHHRRAFEGARERGLRRAAGGRRSPYRLTLDAEQDAWIATVIDWKRAA